MIWSVSADPAHRSEPCTWPRGACRDFAGGHSERDAPTVEGVPVSLLRRLAVAVERLQ